MPIFLIQCWPCSQLWSLYSAQILQHFGLWLQGHGHVGMHTHCIQRAARYFMYSELHELGPMFAFPCWYLMSASLTLGWLFS